MKNRKRITLAIFAIFLINLFLVNAVEPSLPTSIYGKILNANMEPAAGIEVTAIWTESDDSQRTSKTFTLSKEEAEKFGDKSLEGNYLFNEGYIKAKLNTQIKIVINGVEFEEVSSNPGGMVKIRDSVLSLRTNSGSASKGSSSGQGTASDDTSSDTASPDSGQDTSSSGSSSGTSSSDKSSGISDYVPTPADGSSTSYSNTKSNPTLPTNLFGQLVDDNNNPIEDEEVIAEWTDEFGIKHTTTTKTLSKQEAKSLGNKSLEGFYSFNKGDIRAKPNSTISIKTQNSNMTKKIKSSPGETTKVEKMQLYGSSENKEVRPIINRIINQTSDAVFESISKQRKNLSIALLALIVLVSTIYFVKHKKQKQKKLPSEYKLYKDTANLLDIKVKTIMIKNVSTISKEDNAFEALNIIISQNKNSLIVVSNNKPIGIISEDDFVCKLFPQKDNLEIDKLKVKDIMSSSVVSADRNITLSECIQLIIKNKIRKLPIVKKSTLIGIVTLTDLLQLFDKFFSKNIIESLNIPSVGNAMSNEVAEIRYDAKLSEVCGYMSKEFTDYALIPGTNSIVTTRDIIEEFYKNPYHLDKLKVAHVMKSPVVFTTPGYNIIEANKIMIEKNFRRLPVVLNKKFVGILNQTDLLNSIYSFLCDIIKKVDRGNS